MWFMEKAGYVDQRFCETVMELGNGGRTWLNWVGFKELGNAELSKSL